MVANPESSNQRASIAGDEWPHSPPESDGRKEPTETDLRDAVEQATDAVEFAGQTTADVQLQATYVEYSEAITANESRIVGDIDRSLVTPDTHSLTNRG